MKREDFKELLILNKEIKKQISLLQTAVGNERIECNNAIAKIKKNHIWKEHKAAADEFERLQSRYDQIKQGTLDWMK